MLIWKRLENNDGEYEMKSDLNWVVNEREDDESTGEGRGASALETFADTPDLPEWGGWTEESDQIDFRVILVQFQCSFRAN